jgi:hypothetical protein
VQDSYDGVGRHSKNLLAARASADAILSDRIRVHAHLFAHSNTVASAASLQAASCSLERDEGAYRMTREETAFALSFKREEGIPALAWCLEASAGATQATVRVGPRVETTADAFIEGAWDGAYAEMAMDQGVCMGSGGRIRDGQLVLSAPSHTLEAVYSARVGDRLLVSNSLPFALTRAGLDLDPHYRAYLIDMRSIMRGLRAYVSRIPTLQRIPVERHFFCNLVISRDLQLRREKKPRPPRFASFADYRAYLRSRLQRITLNANDRSRSFAHRLLATVSRGYDSPACAVLAKECGCARALTISDASWGNPVDSGLEIGELLFDDVVERKRQAYLHKAGMPEAEFAALGDAGDVPFSSFEDVLTGCILTTGFHGDKVWDPHNPHTGPDVRRGDASGSSLGEFRLRTGFIHVPVPFIGCENHADINAIGRSAELDPWRVGGRYDRPIPRRIAEDAGIPRELFGQEKSAAATWWTQKPPKAESRESYEKFRGAHRRSEDTSTELVHSALYWLSRRWVAFGSLAARALRKLGLHVHIPQVVPLRFTEPAAEAQLVQWGVSRVRQRYRRSA